MLDKAALVLTAVETSPASLGDLVARTGLTRATAHRLAAALEVHRLVGRDPSGRFVPGPRLAAGGAAPLPWALLAAATPVLAHLRDATGESTQLYVRRGDVRVCVAAAERASGLRDTVPVGTMLPMTAGSGAQVLLAFGADPFPGRDATAPATTRGAAPTAPTRGTAPTGLAKAVEPPAGAAFGASTLAQVRRRGWAESVGEREAGLASVSAPVRDATGRVVAALSLSGPVERLTRSPGRRHGATVAAAAERLSRQATEPPNG